MGRPKNKTSVAEELRALVAHDYVKNSPTKPCPPPSLPKPGNSFWRKVKEYWLLVLVGPFVLVPIFSPPPRNESITTIDAMEYDAGTDLVKMELKDKRIYVARLNELNVDLEPGDKVWVNDFARGNTDTCIRMIPMRDDKNKISEPPDYEWITYGAPSICVQATSGT